MEPTFKENEFLHGEVKAHEDEIAGLKEERTRLSQRIYQVQLDRRNMEIDCDIAREELATAQEELATSQLQLAEIRTQLATVVEERNGK